MAKGETCRIDRNRRKEGFFRKKELGWIAIIDTAQGPQQIDQTIEYEIYESDNRKSMEKFSAINNGERSKLVGRLLASGWEPIDGVTFKRPVS